VSVSLLEKSDKVLLFNNTGIVSDFYFIMRMVSFLALAFFFLGGVVFFNTDCFFL